VFFGSTTDHVTHMAQESRTNMEPLDVVARLQEAMVVESASARQQHPFSDRPRRGDNELFEELYRNHYQAMVRLACGMVGSRAVAEDLVQDAFVAVAARLHRVEQPVPYLRTAVLNACRGHHRRLRIERRADQDLRTEGATFEVTELWDALALLTARQRAVILLRFYEDLPEAAVASTLRCRPGTVKSLTARALERLREVVER